MHTSTVDEVVLDEKIWNAWIQKGKRSDHATNRNIRVLAGIGFVLLALVSAFRLAT